MEEFAILNYLHGILHLLHHVPIVIFPSIDLRNYYLSQDVFFAFVGLKV